MKKLLSILLTLSLLTGSLLCFSFSAGALYYTEGQKVSRVITDEGIILLKNENAALPLASDEKVAIFGEAQKFNDNGELWNSRGYIPYGYGSQTQVGDFDGKQIDPLDALLAAEQDGEISIYHKMSDSYAAGLAESTPYVPTDEDIEAAAGEAQTAIVFLNRWAGEVFDVARGDWYLNESEKALLRQLTASFEKERNTPDKSPATTMAFLILPQTISVQADANRNTKRTEYLICMSALYYAQKQK